MDAIEKAIRGALEKGDAEDRTFREKVYRSVFGALERNIAVQPDLAPEVAQRRREALKAKIVEIEQEFQPAVPAPRSAGAPAIRVDEAAGAEAPPVRAGRSADREPTAEAPEIESPGRTARFAEPGFGDFAAERTAPGFEAGPPGGPPVGPPGGPTVGPPGGPPGVLSAGERSRPAAAEPRRRPWAAMLIAVTLLAALAIGGWWAMELGLFGRPDTSVPNPAESADEDFMPEPLGPAAVESGRDWIILFSPADPTAVIAPSGARADVMDEEGEPFIRIRSGPDGEAVLFDIGQGILERLAGRAAVFDIAARAEEGKETQISIRCNFGELGDCGRRRYLVGTHRADYLFDVDLPTGRPGAAGSIAIVSDVENAGKAIDVFEIRVSVGE